MVGCSPWGRKESDMTERLTLTYLILFIGQMLLDDLEAITGVLLLSDISCLMYIVGGYLDQ